MDGEGRGKRLVGGRLIPGAEEKWTLGLIKSKSGWMLLLRKRPICLWHLKPTKGPNPPPAT